MHFRFSFYSICTIKTNLFYYDFFTTTKNFDSTTLFFVDLKLKLSLRKTRTLLLKLLQPIILKLKGEKPTTQMPTTESPTTEPSETTSDYDVTTEMTVTPAPFSFSLREVTSSLVEIYLKSSDDVTRYVIKLTIMGDDATVERKEIVVDKEKEEMLFQLTMLPAGFCLFFI